MAKHFDLLRRGITKIELALILVVCTVLVALLFPALQKVREASAQTQCTNNLRQIGLSLHNFEGTFKRLPPLYGGNVIGTQFTASVKFPRIWASTHVFINPYMEASYQYSEMRTGDPQNILPSLVQERDCPTYICPADPSTSVSANLGGTSYTANAQVFAPLRDETTGGSGEMFAMTDANFCDRGTTVAGIKDGASNTIGFLHSYSLCGSDKQGTSWLYTTGIQQPPEPTQTFQPWARATYIGQKGMTGAGDKPFQNAPSPYDQPYDPIRGRGCDPLLPATPHRDTMLVGLMDASARSITQGMTASTWNKACLPNDGSQIPGPDWDD